MRDQPSWAASPPPLLRLRQPRRPRSQLLSRRQSWTSLQQQQNLLQQLQHACGGAEDDESLFEVPADWEQAQTQAQTQTQAQARLFDVPDDWEKARAAQNAQMEQKLQEQAELAAQIARVQQAQALMFAM